VPGAVEGAAWRVCSKDVRAPRVRPGNSVFQDHVPTHTRAAIAAALPAVDAQGKVLPPSSPDFAPLEKCWSQGKTFLRRVAARTQQDRDAALSQALAMMTGDAMKGWFAHCGSGDALN